MVFQKIAPVLVVGSLQASQKLALLPAAKAARQQLADFPGPFFPVLQSPGVLLHIAKPVFGLEDPPGPLPFSRKLFLTLPGFQAFFLQDLSRFLQGGLSPYGRLPLPGQALEAQDAVIEPFPDSLIVRKRKLASHRGKLFLQLPGFQNHAPQLIPDIVQVRGRFLRVFPAAFHILDPVLKSYMGRLQLCQKLLVPLQGLQRLLKGIKPGRKIAFRAGLPYPEPQLIQSLSLFLRPLLLLF